MPEQLKHSEITKEQDPSVTKQYDNNVTLDEKYEDFAAIADKLGVCMFGTFRPGTGVRIIPVFERLEHGLILYSL